jgi:uncharacterized protein YbjT (DUF2867 family)
MDGSARRLRVVIAGASGFVGRALARALAADFDVVGLSRVERPRGADGIEWRACDLFSLLDTEKALAGADVVFYLVHSMMPSARLTQGSFADMDLICADNVARAAKNAGARGIVYLGGLIPPGEASLSPHLASRLEVERTLGSRGVPVTSLRAGLILGADGSSFQMMVRLVERLPVMVSPRWTRSLTQPVALEDVVAALRYALEHPEIGGHAYDLGGPDVLSYSALLQETARALGKTRPVLTLPVDTVRLSLLWVSLVSGAPMDLVRPLVQSLRHDMIAHDGLALQARAGIQARPLREALARAVEERDARHAADAAMRPPQDEVRARRRKVRGDRQVRSVQRLPMPAGWDASVVAREYGRWLPRFMRPFLRVETDASGAYSFFLRPLKTALLVLTFAPERSTPDRSLYYITGGLLARVQERPRGRLEFRTVLGGTRVLAAIHDFVPTLPWLIYSGTQALVHLFVMRAFGRHLARTTEAPGAPRFERADPRRGVLARASR